MGVLFVCGVFTFGVLSSSLKVPCYNPCGRYLIKLFAAGRWRRVEVDDSIPLDATGRPVRSIRCTQYVRYSKKSFIFLAGAQNRSENETTLKVDNANMLCLIQISGKRVDVEEILVVCW